MGKELRAAILGCGAIAKKRHAPACKALENVHLAGVYDVDPDSAQALAKQYGTTAYTDLDELLDKAKPDAVCVCTPPAYHSSLSIQCMKAGKDVLCEKPTATSVKEAEEMAKVSAETGARLMIAFSNRMYTEHQTIKRLIREGAVGTPFLFKTMLEDPGVENLTGYQGNDFYDRFRGRVAGGVMSGYGCHRVDLVRYLFDSPIVSVSAFAPTLDKHYSDGRKIEPDDTAIMTMKLKNGIVGTAFVSTCNYGAGNLGTEVYGTEGILRYQGGNTVELWKGNKCKEYSFEKSEEEKAGYGIVQNFLRSCMGLEQPITVIEDGVACMKVLEAAHESNRAGKWIDL